MLKKIIAGTAALTVAACSLSLASSAIKLGDVNCDNKIDIEDAVAVINQVNGVSRLSDDQQRYADVDYSKKVDIEDAVKIINHINGVTPLPDVHVTPLDESSGDPSSTPDDSSSQPDVPKYVTLSLTNNNKKVTDDIVLEYGSPIPAKYGKGADPNDKSTYDPESWFLIEFPNKEMMGQEFTQEVSEICYHDPVTGEQKNMQTLIDKNTPITEDINFYILFTGHSIAPYGKRTLAVFDEMLDNNYRITFKSSQAYAEWIEVSMQGDILQKDEKNSNIKATVDVMGEKNSDIYTIDGNTYYVRDAENKTYSTKPEGVEGLLDIKQIFTSLATDREHLKFVEETRDNEQGLIIETFDTRLSIGDLLKFENIRFNAYFDKSSGELVRLTVMDMDSYEENHPEYSELYLDTAELNFEPKFDGDIEAPDFSTWTEVEPKGGLL